jgi:2,3-bisphosphoglycerate-dependent phosphoglycerate mutase
VPLTAKGEMQAKAAGRCLQAFNVHVDAAFTSLLRRSKDSFEMMQSTGPGILRNVPVMSTWRMNERHYGALTGLSKETASDLFGKANVDDWRRSWKQRPPPMTLSDTERVQNFDWTKPFTSVHEPLKHKWTALEKGASMPMSESLEDCMHRVLPVWDNYIVPRLKNGESILFVAHANTIRALIYYIDRHIITFESFKHVHIPPAIPIVYSFAADADGVTALGEPNDLGMRGRYLITEELLEMNLKHFDADHDKLECSPETDLYFTAIVHRLRKKLADKVADKRVVIDGHSERLHEVHLSPDKRVMWI